MGDSGLARTAGLASGSARRAVLDVMRPFLRVARLVDSMTPLRLRDGDPNALRRARIILWILLVMELQAAVFIVIHWAVGAPAVSIGVLVVAGVATTVPRMLRRSIHLAAHFEVALFVAVLDVIAWYTGGIHAPSLQWTVIAPVMAMMVSGRRSGLAWLGIVGANVLVFASMAASGRTWVSVFTPKAELIVSGLAVAMLASVIVAFAWVYESANAAMVMTIDQSNQDLQKAANRLEAARDVALEATRAKSEFLANMSHEIRTPLNGVIGMIELLFLTKLSQEQGEYCQIARTSAEALLGVISDILDFSKIEAGKMELEAVDFDLRGLAEDVADIVATKAREKRVELIVSIEPGVPRMVRGDPLRVRQMLLNLASNAVKFTEHGEVELNVSMGVKAAEDDAPCTIAIRDTGLGIPPEELAGLFQPFMQVDVSTTRRFGGTGLGLAITRELAVRMGGKVAVSSVLGEGSVFTLHLPLVRSASPPPSEPARESLRGVTVLLVDDNGTSRTVLSRILERWGAVVIACESGEQALLELRTCASAGRRVDIVLSDDQMPNMDGSELAYQLRREAMGAPIPFVLATSTSRVEKRDSTIAAVLLKPIKAAQLHHALSVSLGLTAVTSAAENTGKVRAPIPVGLRVLLVEDNVVNQRVIQILLEKAGAKVEIAKDGAEGVLRYITGHYDLVLMDCQMPVMDGFEATRQIREREAPGTRVPILALTANASEADGERCIAASMDAHLTKPIRPRDLYAAINKYARARAPEVPRVA